jgi:KDO2-lipid IV(A) lauroyltransferase
MAGRRLMSPPPPDVLPDKSRGLVHRATHTDLFYRLTTAVVRGAAWMTNAIGPDRMKTAAGAVVRVAAPLIPENRVAIANVAAAFPQKSDAERQEIVAGCWNNLARVFIEFIVLERLAAGFDPSNPGEGLISFHGMEHVDALRKPGPAIIVGAHLANWELVAIVLAKLGVQLVVPYLRPTNPHIAALILDRRKRLMGSLVDENFGAAAAIAAHLKRGDRLCMLIDQRQDDGVVVPFLGRPAKTNVMTMRLARLFDCPVYGIRVIRLAGDRFRCELVPVALPRDESGKIDIMKSLGVVNRMLERWIAEYPEQWLWLHNRWKM